MLRRVKEILLLGFIAVRVPENGSRTPEKGFDTLNGSSITRPGEHTEAK